MAIERTSVTWTDVTSIVRGTPSDVVLGLGYLVIAAVVAVLSSPGSAARVLVGVPLLFFVPGYAFVTALLPRRRDREARASGRSGVDRDRAGIDAVERASLSFGLSLGIVPLAAGGLILAGVGVRLPSLVGALAGLSAAGLVASGLRRRGLPPDQRFDPSVMRWLRSEKRRFVDAPGRLRLALNGLLALSVLVAAVTMGYALFATGAETADANMMLLTENESGSYVAAGYPDAVATNESAELVVGVENDGRRSINCTVVVLLQRVQPGETSVRVLSSSELTRLHGSVPPGEAWYAEHSVQPSMTGDRLRLTYLLYRGDAPADPSIDSAYRHTYHWIDVRRPSS